MQPPVEIKLIRPRILPTANPHIVFACTVNARAKYKYSEDKNMQQQKKNGLPHDIDSSSILGILKINEMVPFFTEVCLALFS